MGIKKVETEESENPLNRPLPPGAIEFTNPFPEPTRTVRQFCQRYPNSIAQLNLNERNRFLELIAGILHR